ncbi:MAG: hypothetical protein RL385_1512 [Pseudomonadota bacterium]|jgi:hypothetical protein
MEALSFGAPGLLFPAISLLMLAFTNRFLGLAGVARGLIAKFHEEPSPAVAAQIRSLRQRIRLTRTMQALGVLSLALCVACLYALFLALQLLAGALFAGALMLMLASLLVSLREIFLSVNALEIEMASVLPEDG